MSASINTILIIGGSRGIGAAFAERFHAMGKTVIITGRSEDKLKQMTPKMTGLRYYTMDMTRLGELGKDISHLFHSFPDIDTVWINGGIQHPADIKDAASSTDNDVVDEITTNVTAPMIIARHVVPLLVAKKTETTIMVTGSGLGFMPVGNLSPVYCATKSAIHSYCVGIRQALKSTSVNVIEIVPPFVATQLADGLGDLAKHVQAMPLADFVEDSFKVLDGTAAKEIREVAPGTAGPRVAVWRDSIGKAMAERGLGD
ncbi:hypothetical protein AMS68_001421 [Peltaster fructicola]|uniref:Uncharacterized protein n=1 Tax=Peltaster fructicola TaxID=286661 RepID=A0A6H0XMF3_9PEZI|nr:hypothetical protein AMS68_001421 [Peltaster fructicola]